MKTSPPRPLPVVAAVRLPIRPPHQLLDVTQDATFTELMRLTAKLFQVPVALIASLQEDTVQVGCTYGLGPVLDQTKQGEALGSLVLLHTEHHVYENLHAVPCQWLNPYLVQQLHLGFYASNILRTKEGQLLGALCILDYQPRAFHSLEVAVLAQLAALVLSLTDLRLLLLQQPTWNQQLWRGIYGRLRSSTQRLKTLAALARWEKQVDNTTSQVYQNALYEEILHLISGLNDHIQVFQTEAR